MRRISATSSSIDRRVVMRYASLDDLTSEWRPELSWLVPVRTSHDISALAQLRKSGVSNLYAYVSNYIGEIDNSLPAVYMESDELLPGDVVAVTPGGSKLQVLYRESDLHHTVFLTNRCNSRCLMCSQPPTEADDSWLIEEARQVSVHIRQAPEIIGFTGGEPLMIGSSLRELIDLYASLHRNTRYEILTNGRYFNDPNLSGTILSGLSNVTWMIPLYGHVDLIHDYIVKSVGAFDETISGLLTLHAYSQSIQLRIVLIHPVLEILPDLCEFIGRNLPFVREVALMGCEPIGYALKNRETCEVDLRDWSHVLVRSVRNLQRMDIPIILMNIPHCALPESMHKYAHRSISDWKQFYVHECEGCLMRKDCSGLFTSVKRGWLPTKLTPVVETA